MVLSYYWGGRGATDLLPHGYYCRVWRGTLDSSNEDKWIPGETDRHITTTNTTEIITNKMKYLYFTIQSGAIIGDGDRKRALIPLLGLSPWYGTIFLFLEQIAPSPVAHARTCCEDFCVCREGKLTSVITEMFDTFCPQQPTTQYVHVCWNFASVFSS